ncbi:hypothetical protein [Vibrio alginolyticus]|uniref:hypothetical protein n=1 Tax=Vibrio alginolyticus TaxID=663 RepID=UPI00211A5957|nr:hypothetical protein [Vibrio alginolyticus]MCQ9090999.1 hypothetical protein [Vibrio alginolyticus]
MTDSNAIHSTITKQPKPTTFSDVEPKASSKDGVDRLGKNTMKTNMTIALCNLELNLMAAVAKRRYTSANEEGATLDIDATEVSLYLGLDLGSRHIGLSTTMREALDNIKLLDASVYDAFVYAYHGSLKAN